ncbi:hypothetical protein LCL86_00465 [Muricauda ruestringensis]|uniref:ApeA N-terminal domain 1-containing protein n=1 Tax=Flagellimonas ruestringensis TaxID=111501 RepID=UPI001CD60C74|nr:HEPN domain-containing protein [Allomuricauda ruestringensis]MCA0957497.1 hypothetical protein [Allomuricauda ruestringensis]
MKKDQKYYGEVWLVENTEVKQFCIMSFMDDDLVLETNLHSPKSAYKEPQIIGIFTGLGYLTFIDCKIKLSSSGITETRVYQPKYSFVSESHFINPSNLLLKEFYIVNNAIVKWINHAPWYNSIKNELTKKEFTDEFEIDNIGLKLSLQHYLQYGLKSRSELLITNKGSINFFLKEPCSLLKAIDLYDDFQKVLQLVFGRSSKFESFKFKCLRCSEWIELHYNDRKLSSSSSTFVHTEYKKIKASLPSILTAAYSNQNFRFCLDKLMENFIGKHPSHNKRFTNSISAYEAFCKLYLDNSIKPNAKLSKWILAHEDVFKKIGDINEKEWKKFPSKVVRSRDFHVHSNVGNRDVFSEFDLLYISFLFDFVIAYLMLNEIKVEQELLDKYVQHGKSVFVDMKRTNAILGNNPLS